MKVKIITAIYTDLNGSKFGGRPDRRGHYRWSLLSLLKMTQADFLCYTSERELESLEDFFYNQYKIDRNRLKIEAYDLENHYFLDLFSKYKDYDACINHKSDRCIEIQCMKFAWFKKEDSSYDYYFWFDAGLCHCGLIPNKYLAKTGIHNSQYYDSNIFDNTFLNNLINNTVDKFTIVSKENQRNYWSGTVNASHFKVPDSSRHVIGGFFGGKKELWLEIVDLFENYLYKVTESDGRLYHEEDIMTLMFRNHPELFTDYQFDVWWHEDNYSNCPEDFFKINKSFYKIIEEIANINE